MGGVDNRSWVRAVDAAANVPANNEFDDDVTAQSWPAPPEPALIWVEERWMTKTRLLAGFFALLCGIGCNEYQLRGNEYTEVFYQTPSVAVDILFVVDNSPSMVHEHQLVVEGFVDFILEVEESESDFQIGVITTDMEGNDGGILLGDPPFISTTETDYASAFMEKIHVVGTGGSGWEKGLQAARTALLDSPAGFGDTENAGFIRWDADLAVAVVSDENDCSDEGALPANDQNECYDMPDLLVPVVNYIEDFQDLKTEDHKVTFSAIVGPEIEEGCEDTKPGHRYMTVAKNMQGLQGNICESDWSGMMSDLGLISTGILTYFTLQAYPAEDTIEVTVDDEPVAHDPDEIDGWSYRIEDNAIYFWGGSMPPRDSEVTIHYFTSSSGE